MRITPLLLIALSWRCVSAQTPPSTTDIPEDAVPLETEPVTGLARASYSGVTDETFTVIRDERAWRDFWQRLSAHQIPRSEPPVINFRERMAVVTAMGRKPTGGHAIEIAGVYRADGWVYVEVIETSPEPACMTTQSFTAPVDAVTVEAHGGDAIFIKRLETTDCE